jgi:hypothetical protein
LTRIEEKEEEEKRKRRGREEEDTLLKTFHQNDIYDLTNKTCH